MKNFKSNMYNFYNEERPNSLAAAIETKLVNARTEMVKRNFVPHEGKNHRVEFVKTIRGVTFVDDAVSENVSSVWSALQHFDNLTEVVWIMNINDIDMVNDALLEVIDEKVKAIIIQGVYNAAVIDFFSSLGKEVSYAMNLEDAVRTAFYTCEQGDAVLYSPGASCEGMYGSYGARGDKFQNAVAQL